MTSFFRRSVVAGLCLSGVLALGCAGRNRDDMAGYPSAPGRTIIAEPGGYEDVYIADQKYVEQQPADGRQVVGYDTLSDGTQVEVVTYEHTYPEQIETFPRVYWANNWYYNVNGDFVYWSPAYGGWVSYWGPPGPLVSCWNVYYPWAPYYWGVGFYGGGWYWGGVGYYGYHAYGTPVVNEYHHHHNYWADSNPGGPSGRPSSGHPGGPTNDPSSGGPTDGPARRKKPDEAPVARRNLPGDTSPQRGAPARRDATPSATQTKPGDRVAGASPQRTAATPNRTVPVRTRTYTTASGQRVTTIDPNARVSSTRNPVAPARTTKTLGSVPANQARDPFARTNAPRWDQPQASPGPARTAGWDTRPSPTPSRSFSPSSSPTRSASPSPSPSPSRSFSPSQSSPSRSFSPPSRSAPSRSFSPSSGGGGGRSMSPPSRSAPSRSFSPSSGGGGGRSFSPSRGGGGGSHAAPMRSGGGGGGAPTRSSGGGGRHR